MGGGGEGADTVFKKGSEILGVEHRAKLVSEEGVQKCEGTRIFFSFDSEYFKRSKKQITLIICKTIAT